MDLYGALKSGITAEDITKGFNKELEEAVKKIEEEQETERLRVEAERRTKSEAALNAARHKAAAEVVEYLRTLFEVEDIEITDIFPANGEALTDLLCHLLEESEKDYRSKLDLARTIKAFAENETAQKKDTTRGKRTSAGTYDSGNRDDDTILSNFLSNLF